MYMTELEKRYLECRFYQLWQESEDVRKLSDDEINTLYNVFVFAYCLTKILGKFVKEGNDNGKERTTQEPQDASK